MKIYVDADACPVKSMIISIATEMDVQVMLIQSYAHYSHAEQPAGVETIYVDTEAEAADYKIMALATKDDVIVTQDYGLAALGLGKGCVVLHHNGFAYTNQNIDRLLQTRHASAMARKAGQKTRGPKAYTAEDEKKFGGLLMKTIEAHRS